MDDQRELDLYGYLGLIFFVATVFLNINGNSLFIATLISGFLFVAFLFIRPIGRLRRKNEP